MTGIYKITSPTNKVYVGQAVDLDRRLKSYAKGRCMSQPKIYNSILKYGWEAHRIVVLEECSELDLNKAERYWQDYYNSVEQGLNLRYTQTDEKSGKLSKEHIDKLKKPKSTTEKMKGPKSAEHIAKIAAANKNKKRGPQKNPHKKVGIYSPQYGIKRPEQSEKRRGSGNPAAKRVDVYNQTGTYIGTYGSQVEIMRVLGFKHTGGISSCCREAVKSYLGYKFNYAN